MKDHYDFYYDNFINDQVGLGSMFPKSLFGVHADGGQGMAIERDLDAIFTNLGPATAGRETLDLKEV
jgi:hypothetical protein